MPEGWPLTLGGSGLILQLGELEASALRLGECYLCVRSAAAATATATTSSVSGATTAGEAVEQNTVEVSHVPFHFFFSPLSSSSSSLPALLSSASQGSRADDVLGVPPRENDTSVLTTVEKTRPEFPAFFPRDRTAGLRHKY